MKRHQLKNAAINWTFQKEEYEEFLEKILPVVDEIPGYLNRLEAFFLYKTAKSIKPVTRQADQPKAESVVEIGSYKGRSTVAIGLGLKENTNGNFRLICVDPFFNDEIEMGLRNDFFRNISKAGLEDMVTHIADYSSKAAEKWPFHEGISMLWIDGNHEFEYVQDDFLSWSRFLVPGGLVAFHDWYLNGVRDVVTKYLFSQDCFQDFSIINRNLVAASKIDGTPTRQQRAIKKRVYWALRTGSTSPLIAFMAMVYEFLNKPFGNLKFFFRSKLDIQRE